MYSCCLRPENPKKNSDSLPFRILKATAAGDYHQPPPRLQQKLVRNLRTRRRDHEIILLEVGFQSLVLSLGEKEIFLRGTYGVLILNPIKSISALEYVEPNRLDVRKSADGLFL